MFICKQDNHLHRKPYEILKAEKPSKNLPDKISEFSKVTRNNIQKSILFLYNNNKQLENEILKVPFIVTRESIKDLGINLTEYVQDVYSEKHNIAERK